MIAFGMLGLCCCAGFSLVATHRGYSLVLVPGASYCRAFSCEAWTLGLTGYNSRGMWAQ